MIERTNENMEECEMTTYANTLKTSELIAELRNRGFVKTVDVKHGETVRIEDESTGEFFEESGPSVILAIPQEIFDFW